MSRSALRVTLLVSVILLLVRLYAADRLGFGDSEALYASYARHPQPVYLDHPGLIGLIARLLGGGDAPSPAAAHRATAVLATLAPWVAAWAARAVGATWAGAGLAALSLILAPEISVGLFGLTPDLPLILLWYAALGFSALGLRREPGSSGALYAALASGVAAGLACDAKVSGVLLLGGMAAAWASPQAKAHRRTLAPWMGLLVALVLFSPVVLDEFERGFPMLRHRLVDTQRGAGLSLRNVGALVGGQLVYVTPPLVWGAFKIGRDLYRHRRDDAASVLLWSVTVACLPLVVLCCFSRAAEPHWVAPLYLALPLHLARHAERWRAMIGARLGWLAIAVSTVTIAFAHAWVLVPLGPRLLGSHYAARYDLANDLFAWQTGLPLVKNALLLSLAPDAPPPVVIGPHWIVCAQLHALLPASILVGCAGEIPSDFSRWLPPSVWEEAPVLLYVSDDRFEDAPPDMPRRRVDAVWHIDVHRGGVVVRRITVRRLISSGTARAALPPPARSL